ncbi:MAG: carboxypeptidase-like regulatory domain-containing protein [Acidobacteria bacterium]|nr:carboxypeptidase-like regulatory domain-containing protein [Acidobacteriota bacterium]
MVRFSIAALMGVLICAPAVFAQGAASAQINGVIRDASGAVVPGAAIIATNADTQAQRKTTSNDDGGYMVPLLPPGKYRISVEKTGFQPLLRSGISLEVDQVATIDMVMQVGNVSQAVEVVASGPLLAVTNPNLGEVVNNVQVESLPMNGRQPFRLLELTPGVFKAPSSNGQYQDVPVNQGNESIFSISGGRARTNEVLIDGVPSTVGTGNTITTIPPVDATEEFNVMSGPLKAEWGRTGGGVLNVYTKSGVNRVHGGIFEFLRNESFDANDFFANTVGQKKPKFRLNQFGFTLGGPVYLPKLYNGKDKTFFFVDYQGTRWVQGSSWFTTVPTAEQRAGNFTRTLTAAGGLVTIFNPFSTVRDPNNATQYVRTPFPGNIIPSSMLNSVSQKALTYVPMPNVPGNQYTNVNNYLSDADRTINETALGIRIDHNFGEREKLFGRVAINRHGLNQPDFYGTVASPGDGALGTVVLNATGASIQSATTISPASVLGVSLGYARWVWNRRQRSWGYNQEDLGLPSSYVKQLQYQLFPAFSIANSGGIGGGSGLTLMSQDTSSLLVSLTRIMGRHTFKTGVDVRMLRNFLITGDPAGSFSFTQAMTSGPNPNVFSAAAGAGIASFMLGAFSSGSVNILAGASQKAMYYAGYIQDDFRVNTKFTVNYGLRWETTSPFTERHNQLNRFNPTLTSPAANSQFPNLQGGLEYASSSNRRMYPWDLNNWQPRLGFAYHAMTHTVLRGGIGLVYSFFPTANADTGFSPNQGFSATTPFLGTVDGVTPYNLLNNPAPKGLNQPTTASNLGAATFLGQNLTVWDKEPSTPRVWQWNFDIQHELKGFLFDLAYVGSRGANLNSPLQINTLSPDYLSLGSGLQQLVKNPFAGTITTGTLANATVQRYQLLLPYPQYTGIAVQNRTWGHSEYHAMELKVKKRMSRSVTMLLGYTVSKLFSDVSNTVTNNGNNLDRGLNSTTQNPYNLDAEWSVSEMDIPNYLSLSTVAELPFGPGRALLSNTKGVVSKLVEGWELSTVLLGRSGFPLVFSAPGVIVGNRPNRSCSGVIEGGRSKDQRVKKWFDTGCFSVPAPFTFGNDSRTNPDIRGPSFTQLDIGLAKHQKLFREAATLTFRAEAFNVFNTVHFAPPELAANNSAFGRISVISGKPRVLQFAIKLRF